jgi:hypothetical protein
MGKHDHRPGSDGGDIPVCGGVQSGTHLSFVDDLTQLCDGEPPCRRDEQEHLARALGSSVIFSPNTPAGDQISIEDYAVALVDEIENPAHARQRFAVAN